VTGKVDHREQQVADLGRCRLGLIGEIKLGFNFVGFLANLGENAVRVIPVETDPAGFVLQLKRAG
jgi:hypothetical protein